MVGCFYSPPRVCPRRRITGVALQTRSKSAMLHCGNSRMIDMKLDYTILNESMTCRFEYRKSWYTSIGLSECASLIALWGM